MLSNQAYNTLKCHKEWRCSVLNTCKVQGFFFLLTVNYIAPNRWHRVQSNTLFSEVLDNPSKGRATFTLFGNASFVKCSQTTPTLCIWVHTGAKALRLRKFFSLHSSFYYLSTFIFSVEYILSIYSLSDASLPLVLLSGRSGSSSFYEQIKLICTKLFKGSFMLKNKDF